MQKTIVITGASGYVAGALREQMRDGGYRLKLISRQKGVRNLAKHEVAYQCALDSVSAWIDAIKDADFVIHLAALTNLSLTENDTQVSRRENVEPVELLIEAIKVTGREDIGVIFASTVTVVGLNNPVPANEDVDDVPVSNYDRNKLEVERLLKSATSKGILNACSLRFANVYGIMGRNASQNKNRGIVNMMIGRALNQQNLTVFGNGNSIRDFVHIRDVVDAIMEMIATPKALNGDAYIVASEEGRTLKQAFQTIANAVNQLLEYNISVTEIPLPDNIHPIETRNFIGDCTKLKNATAWYPKVSFEQGIYRDIEALSSSDNTDE